LRKVHQLKRESPQCITDSVNEFLSGVTPLTNAAVPELLTVDLDMAEAMADDKPCFWSVPLSELSEPLNSTLEGLTAAEAERRVQVYGPNQHRVAPVKSSSP
jgi:hypothetical protein